MSELARSLQDYSELCWHLAAQCKTRRAGRFMRMLAADLRLAAEKSRAAERRALTEQLDELDRLVPASAPPRGGGPATSGSASTA